MITVSIKTAADLLRGYLGRKVTITYKDHVAYAALLRYAQGLHAKCDELGKQRDTLCEQRRRLSKELSDVRAELMGPWEYEDMTRRIMELGLQRDELGRTRDKWIENWSLLGARLGIVERERDDTMDEVSRLRDERDHWHNAWQDECDVMAATLRMERVAADLAIEQMDEAREWARKLLTLIIEKWEDRDPWDRYDNPYLELIYALDELGLWVEED